MWNQKPCYRFEIDNFSEKEVALVSKVFMSGGYEWYLDVYPKGEDSFCDDDHLSLFLRVTNSKPLGSRWKRIANFYFVLLNHSNKELYRSCVEQHIVFNAESLSWGFQETLPLSKFQEKSFLEKDKLIVEVYIQIVQSFDGYVSEETVDINGFQVLASQANPVRKIFAEHPELAEDFKPKNQVVRTEYMNVLVNLIETLNKPLQNNSENEISNAQSKLSELMEIGFKLDWLKLKLDEVSLKRTKKSDAHDVQQLEMDMNFKLDCLKSKLDEVSLEREKSSYDADGSWVKEIERRIKNLEINLNFKLDCLKSKLEISLERKKSNDDADGSRVKEMEGRIKKLEMMVSDLMGIEKAKSCADDFLLIDKVD